MAKTDELELDPNARESKGKGKLIIIIVLAVLIAAGAGIGALFFMGVLDGGNGGEVSDKEQKSDATERKVVPAFYYDLAPPFIVNFEDQTHAAYLQVEMQAMMHDERVKAQLTKHMPVIRNNILLLMGSQRFDVVKTRQGKEALQAAVLKTVQKIVGPALKEAIEKETEKKMKVADVPNVEQIFFTSFIMQ